VKLLLENWRKHLKEVNDDDDRYTGSPIGSIPPGTEDQQEEQSRQNAIEQFTKLKDDLDRGGGLNIPSRSDEEAALIGALEYAIRTLAPPTAATPADSDEDDEADEDADEAPRPAATFEPPDRFDPRVRQQQVGALRKTLDDDRAEYEKRKAHRDKRGW